jgi:hypothetical protein
MVLKLGLWRGEEEIEYCLIRMGGSIARESDRGSALNGYASRISRGERRLNSISFS